MKRFLALMLVLCLSLTCLSAFAEEGEETYDESEETGAATNPYSFQAMDATLNLPAGITVTDESATDTGVTLTLEMDGRTDVGYSFSINYNEAYADYTTADLPDEMVQELVDYYSANYQSDELPCMTEADDESMAFAAPFMASGIGADGNLYCIYIMILNGMTMTVSAGIAAEEFDYDSYGLFYNLYWQGVEMFMDNFGG